MVRFLTFFSLISQVFLSSARAEMPKGVALSAAGLAIGSDVGFTLGLATPYWIGDRSALQLQAATLSGNKKYYDLYTLGLLGRVYETQGMDAYFKSAVMLLPKGEPKYGLQYGVGFEFAEENSPWVLFGEFIYSLSFDSTYGRGAGVTVGFKFYL